EIPVKIETIPVFARSGAVIPMRTVIQHVDDGSGARLDQVILHVFPGNGGGRLYGDDGISYEYEQGRFFEEVYASRQAGSLRELTLVRRLGDASMAPASYVVRFEG